MERLYGRVGGGDSRFVGGCVGDCGCVGGVGACV